jgi:hypothetical protein
MMKLLLLLVARASAHGAVTWPPPRNAIDSDDAPAQANQTYPYHGQACPMANGGNGTSGANGQACYWFSNGASIGCAVPNAKTRGPIPTCPCNETCATHFDGMCARKEDTCGAKAQATICDPKLRTVNTGAECGSAQDYYYYSPWRAPGSSGVFDSCGLAGGHTGDCPKDDPSACFGGHYVTTRHAKQGDPGSRLAPRPTSTTWVAGESVDVAFTMMANHGGGYQYRLCPAGEPLTEECFFRRPLEFSGRSSFRWDASNGQGGRRVYFDGDYVSTGTLPAGSTWAKNPLPRNDVHNTLAGFAPKCEERQECDVYSRDKQNCLCSGMWGPYNVEVVDQVLLPADLPAGDYVLGWRWDCEESNQIWASCSDVTVVHHEAK